MLMLHDTFSPEFSVNCHITINCTDLLHAVRDVALAVQETNSVYCQKPIKDELNLMPNSDSRYDCCYLLLSSSTANMSEAKYQTVKKCLDCVM